MARSSKGGRYRKSAKIDALRECRDEILEAYRSGLNIHRIAQIFRERNVDICAQHLMRAIRFFIAEGERRRVTLQLLREPVPLKQLRRGPSRTKCLSCLPLLFERRILPSNCALHVTWLVFSELLFLAANLCLALSLG